MLKFLCDIAPLPSDFDRPPRVIRDTVDTIVNYTEQVVNTTPPGHNSSLPFILGGIAAALVALGFIIFIVRSKCKQATLIAQ